MNLSSNKKQIVLNGDGAYLNKLLIWLLYLYTQFYLFTPMDKYI